MTSLTYVPLNRESAVRGKLDPFNHYIYIPVLISYCSGQIISHLITSKLRGRVCL